MPRALSILLIYVVLILLMVAAVAALAPVVAGDALALQRELPDYTAMLQHIAASLPNFSGDSASFSIAGIEQEVSNHASTLARSATEIGWRPAAPRSTSSSPSAFFLSVEPGVVLGGAERWVPARHQERVWRIVRNIHESIGAWARGQLAIAIIFGAVMGIGLEDHRRAVRAVAGRRGRHSGGGA